MDTAFSYIIIRYASGNDLVMTLKGISVLGPPNKEK